MMPVAAKVADEEHLSEETSGKTPKRKSSFDDDGVMLSTVLGSRI